MLSYCQQACIPGIACPSSLSLCGCCETCFAEKPVIWFSPLCQLTTFWVETSFVVHFRRFEGVSFHLLPKIWGSNVATSLWKLLNESSVFIWTAMISALFGDQQLAYHFPPFLESGFAADKGWERCCCSANAVVAERSCESLCYCVSFSPLAYQLEGKGGEREGKKW